MLLTQCMATQLEPSPSTICSSIHGENYFSMQVQYCISSHVFESTLNMHGFVQLLYFSHVFI